MGSKLGQIFEVIREYGEAENEYEQQIQSTESALLEFSEMEAQGRAGDLVRDYVQIELMSLEESLHRLKDKGCELAAAIRATYGLNPNPYSAGERK